MNPARRWPTFVRNRRREPHDECRRAIRDGRHRRKPGGPGGRLSPCERRPAVPDPGRQRPDWRRLAQPLGFPPALHARALRRAAGMALSRARLVVPDEGRNGRLPRGVRRALRAARSKRGPCRQNFQGRRPVRRRIGERPHRGRQRRRRDRRAPALPASRVRASARSQHRSAPLERVLQSSAASGGRRARRRRRQLRSGDLLRGQPHT